MAASVNVYAQADTLKYWNAMRALRDSQPIVQGPRGTVQVCNADLGGSDDTYGMRCPAPWLAYDVAPSNAAVQLCFPIDYFNWCKRYINEALRQEPPISASAEARVVWTLDVWAHVSYALFALNVNWSAQNEMRLKNGLAPSISVGWLLDLLHGSGSLGPDMQAARDAEYQRALKAGGNTYTLEQYRVAEIVSTVSFSSLPVDWVHSYFARGSTKTPNPLWTLLLDTVQPWSSNWSRNWLTSKGNKDASDVAAYANEPPLATAVMQWRLLSARDFESSAISKVTRYNGLPRLSEYITAVSRQPQGATVTFEGLGTIVAVPTHAWGVLSVKGHAAALLALDYKATITRAFTAHAEYSKPKFTAAGLPMTVDQALAAVGLPPLSATPAYARPPQLRYLSGSEFAEQFVTPADWRDLWKGEKDRVTARIQAGIIDPRSECGSDVACQKAVEASQELERRIEDIPLYGQLMGGMRALASLLVGIVGGAIGAGYYPFRPLEAPVARTLTAVGWSLASDGSTADIWKRWGIAAANYASVIPGLFTTAWPSTSNGRLLAPRKPTGACVTESVSVGGDQVFCTVCKDAPMPACAKHMPAYAAVYEPAKLPALTVARNTAATSVVDSCNALALQWALDNPQYSDCVTPADLPMWQQICRAVSLKQLTIEAGVAMWAQYVVNVKACGLRPKELPSVPSVPSGPGTRPSEPGTLWSVLTDGVVHGVNPLRALSASRAFTGSVLSPFNPLRSFLGGRS